MKKHQTIAVLFSLFSIAISGQSSADLTAHDYPDLYGSVLFDEAPAMSIDVAAHPGFGDNYGSILLDPTPNRTADVVAHPGYGDSYGSILLDLNSKNSSHTVVQQDSVNMNSNT